MKSEKHISHKLKVDFTDVRYGLLYFTLTLDGKPFETRFSDVFDPLLRFKKWLEAICVGVHQCSFWFETEGDEIKFDFESEFWRGDRFTVTRPYPGSEIILSGHVERKQIVREFYTSLIRFYNSSDLLKNNWEIEYMWERLIKILKVDYDTLVNEFSLFESVELGDLLFKAHPQYLLSCPSAGEDKAFGYLVNYVLDKKVPDEHQIVETPMSWNIPKKYDTWTEEKKKIFVKKCLNHKVSDQEGTKLADFKSEIIENFLGIKRKIKTK